MIEHRFESTPNHGPRLATNQAVACPRQREEMNIEIRRVTVVIRRLLEIDAVLAYLLRRLIEQYLQPQIAPSCGAFQFRQRGAQVEQPQSLAGQVRVGAEIIREML